MTAESHRFAIDGACAACGHPGLDGFLRATVPANSNILLRDREEALAFPTGRMEVGLCHVCGFIGNAAFDPDVAEYGERYEETQGFSPRFLAFARSLARDWVERYGLAGRSVLEIGCGKGEFLTLMAEEGIGSGIGIDPGLKLDRIDPATEGRLSWHQRKFTPADGDLIGDAVVCRHTLEHVHPVRGFLAGIRSAIGDRPTLMLFELPDSMRILDEVAFWDIYYEHSAYFTEGSLARLFERAGFEVLDVRYEYDRQYLILEARAIQAGVSADPWDCDDLETIERGVDRFAAGYAETIAAWRDRLRAHAAGGETTVVWGASSKAVAFLGLVGEHVAAAVDINPHKHGTFMPGTGHEVLSPDDLADLQPDLVVAMNPVYLSEIRTDLDRVGVGAELVGL